MATPTSDDEVLALVHRGWDHLKRQRPLAAWAAWQQALRLRPDDPAAQEALDRLAQADDLPASARAAYRFRNPATPEARARWDARLRGEDLHDPADAARAFNDLVLADPADAAAVSNLALCLAWAGQNAGAVIALDRAVALDAASGATEDAVRAWSLAEVLRQGAGAEHLADDLDHALIVPREPGEPLPGGLGPLVPFPTPPGDDPDLAAWEWLDRPMPPASPDLEAADLPRVNAAIIQTSSTLRLSSPDPVGLQEAEAWLTPSVGSTGREVRRVATPLPLTLLDAAAWTFRIPPGLDADERRRLSRAAVESYYEDRWIRIPRQGLDGRSPLEASRAAAEGDTLFLAKLLGIIRLREQLGARPRTAELYGGYPFDRLRRRLGLELRVPEAVDPADFGCMSGPELDKLDPSSLDDPGLASAFASAEGLGDDPRTARFAAELAGRLPFHARPGLARVDRTRLFAVLVRDALTKEGPTGALAQLDRAASRAGDDLRATLDDWRSEILARSPEATPDA